VSEPNEVVLSDEEQFDALIAERRAAESGDPPPQEVIPESNEPAPEAGSSVVGSENAESAPDAPAEIDLDSLPPHVRARVERAAALETEIARERSDKLAALNRLQPTQRRLAELERKVAESAKPAPQVSPDASDAEPDYGSPEWKQYEAEFPNEAKAIRKVNESLARRLAAAEARIADSEKRTGEKLGTVDELMQERAKARETAALSEVHPDWSELVLPTDQSDAVHVGNTAQNEPIYLKRQFFDWLSVQDEDIQKWFGSDSANKNIALMDQYKRDLALADWHERSTAPAETAITPEAEAAARKAQRREQNRASSVAPDLRGGSSAVARVDTSQMSDADLFDHLARQKRASNR
jgi:hypothetical protein